MFELRMEADAGDTAARRLGAVSFSRGRNLLQ